MKIIILSEYLDFFHFFYKGVIIGKETFRKDFRMNRKNYFERNINIMNNDCAYCAKGELVAKFGYEVCELPASVVYLFKEQTHPGRCIVASKHHVDEIVDLGADERQAFMEDVALTAKALHKAFNPDKVNYGMYGDTVHHLHMHLCPKYKDEFEWGTPFAMDPNLKKLTTDEACEEVAAKLRSAIEALKA